MQAVSEGGVRRLYSRTGDDISGAFPDLVEAMNFDGALDGELLVGDPPEATGTFSDLQQRLNRKTRVAEDARPVSGLRALLRPAAGSASDDLRALPFAERRARLEAFVATLDPTRFDLSPMVAFRRLGGARRDAQDTRRIRSSRA